MTNAEDSVLVQASISAEAAARMRAARRGLAQTVAAIDQGAFITAAINHYALYLSKTLNGGTDWLTDDRYTQPEQVKELSGRTAAYRPVVSWARMDTKRTPSRIQLHRQLAGATQAVAEIYPHRIKATGNQARGYRAMLRSAGLEVDPDRSEYQDDGQWMIPVRYRRR